MIPFKGNPILIIKAPTSYKLGQVLERVQG